MAKRALLQKIQRFTNVNASTNPNPTFVPYDFGALSLTNTMRCQIHLSCIALESTDTGALYSVQYIARHIYTWKSSTLGTIVRSIVDANDTTSSFVWGFDTGGTGAISGNGGMPRVQMHALSGANIWTVSCAARITNFVEY